VRVVSVSDVLCNSEKNANGFSRKMLMAYEKTKRWRERKKIRNKGKKSDIS
jgi:hypothetical protein